MHIVRHHALLITSHFGFQFTTTVSLPGHCPTEPIELTACRAFVNHLADRQLPDFPLFLLPSITTLFPREIKTYKILSEIELCVLELKEAVKVLYKLIENFKSFNGNIQ